VSRTSAATIVQRRDRAHIKVHERTHHPRVLAVGCDQGLASSQGVSSVT